MRTASSTLPEIFTVISAVFSSQRERCDPKVLLHILFCQCGVEDVCEESRKLQPRLIRHRAADDQTPRLRNLSEHRRLCMCTLAEVDLSMEFAGGGQFGPKLFATKADFGRTILIIAISVYGRRMSDVTSWGRENTTDCECAHSRENTADVVVRETCHVAGQAGCVVSFEGLCRKPVAVQNFKVTETTGDAPPTGLFQMAQHRLRETRGA
ncbi:hypothetical protein BaRGS_00039871 [Batillaria attramentaria]|uniref:Uncharacterized protein n=1 Tax=Batillaria attramentaria TaxID=370345 RepID=A0ABD0J1W2_9CAEN